MRFHAHKLIRDTAVDMAEVVYEDAMINNKVYHTWAKQCPELTPKLARERFIALLYPLLLEQARHTLAGMLRGNYADALKEQIHDALVKDQMYREGRNRALASKYRDLTYKYH